MNYHFVSAGQPPVNHQNIFAAQEPQYLYDSILDLFRAHLVGFCQSVLSSFPKEDKLETVLDLSESYGILSCAMIEQRPELRIDLLEKEPTHKAVVDYVKSRCPNGGPTVIHDLKMLPQEARYDLLILPYSHAFNHTDTLQEYLKWLNKNGSLLLLWKAPTIAPGPFDLFSHLSERDHDPLIEAELPSALEDIGFYLMESIADGLLCGDLYRQSENIITAANVNRSFIELTERIANSRTNVLKFDGPDMIFTRSEIHLIKMIGLNPGIYSAELARLFGITRPVVHKILSKLSDRGFVLKKDDETDKKKLHLYLTDMGWQAYHYHEQYHKENDQALLDFLSDCTDEQLQTIGGFLKHAIKLIENHA